MAIIKPFKAVHPTADKVSLVTSRSYDDYGAAELAAYLEFNPFSFLHILNPAYVNQQKIGFDKRFKMVAHKYAEESKVAVRHVRRDGIDILKKLEKDGDMTKDDAQRQSDQVQKATDQHIAEIDQALAAKEKEILHV